ncbi:MAG: FtsH protease activity modulator HflK [Oscillospiraceae bacterium]|nr:FtsH protease activity modulator HflK [Oscillospiraceae bacterium]
MDEKTNLLEKIKLGAKGSAAIVAVIAIVFILATQVFYSVSEDEQAVVTTFGKVTGTESAGLHAKVPFIQRVYKVDMTTHGVGIGYEILGGGQNIPIDTDAKMITSDFNLINVDFYMEYRISDPVAYLFNTEQPEMILANEALSCIRAVVSDFTVDDVMTTGKGQIQSEIRDMLAEELAEKEIGIAVVNITVQDAEPPTEEVALAFKEVETAKQGRETAINNANKYRNEQLPAAQAEADRIVQAAEAKKAARIAEAEGEVAKFNKVFEEYQKYPQVTKKRMFYETMEDILPDLEVVISDGNVSQYMPIEVADRG